MNKPRPILALAALCLAGVIFAATAFAGTVKLTPVKGATYTGIVGNLPITVKVDRQGKTAKVNLSAAPAFCASGGGAEPHSSKAATISKNGALSAKVTFFTTGSTRRELATVVISAHFYIFSGPMPVLQGTVKSTFSGGAKACSGQESFQAVRVSS